MQNFISRSTNIHVVCMYCTVENTCSVCTFLADCGEPELIPGTYVNAGLTMEGAVRVYTCHGHTVQEGNPYVVCRSDGKWSKPEFYCRRRSQLADNACVDASKIANFQLKIKQILK